MTTTLYRIEKTPGTEIAKIADGDNRWTVTVTDLGSYSVLVSNRSTGAWSLVPTQSSVGTILLLKENLSAPAFAQAAWTLLRFSASQLARQSTHGTRRTA